MSGATVQWEERGAFSKRKEGVMEAELCQTGVWKERETDIAAVCWGVGKDRGKGRVTD